MNRRDFLRVTASTAAVALAGRSLHSETGARKKRNIKKGVGWGMIAGNASVSDKFKLLKELGFDGVELNRPGGPPIDELLAAREATGIAIGNIIDSVHWKQTLSDPDPGIRSKGLEGLQAALREAKALDCKTVLLVPAVVNKQVSYADAYQRSQEEIRKAIPLAEELGVKIAIENVWNQFLLSPLEAARYVDEFNSPSVGWHFDVGNVVTYGWPEQWIRVLGKRIVNVHIKEFSRSKRDSEGLRKGFQVELLEGDCDWPAVMAAFDDIGYEGWAIAEIPGGDAVRLKEIAARMDRIFAS